MKCQILFSAKKKIVNLSSAEFVHRVIKGNEFASRGSSYRDILIESCFKRKQRRRTACSFTQSS